MFPIDESKQIDPNDALDCFSDHEILIFNGDPAVVRYQNPFGDWVLRAHWWEEWHGDDNDERVLYLLLPEEYLRQFEQGLLTLRGAIKLAYTIYVEDRHWCNTDSELEVNGEPHYYRIEPTDIPEEFLPPEDSFLRVEDGKRTLTLLSESV